MRVVTWWVLIRSAQSWGSTENYSPCATDTSLFNPNNSVWVICCCVTHRPSKYSSLKPKNSSYLTIFLGMESVCCVCVSRGPRSLTKLSSWCWLGLRMAQGLNGGSSAPSSQWLLADLWSFLAAGWGHEFLVFHRTALRMAGPSLREQIRKSKLEDKHFLEPNLGSELYSIPWKWVHPRQGLGITQGREYQGSFWLQITNLITNCSFQI